jgi:hypothetical protein
MVEAIDLNRQGGSVSRRYQLAGHRSPEVTLRNDDALKSGEAPPQKLFVINERRHIFRALCRSPLRAVKREKQSPSGSKSPLEAKCCERIHLAATFFPLKTPSANAS